MDLPDVMGDFGAGLSTRRRLDDEAKGRIDRLYRRGVSVEALADQFRLAPARVGRILTERRALRLMEAKLDFISHPSFDDPSAHAAILADLPAATGPSRRAKVPADVPPYLASLYDVPLLSREQEAHLFRKMNFLKHQAGALRQTIDPTRARAGDLDRIEGFQEEALAVKNQIIRANLRLVVSIAKKYVGPSKDFFELVSDGNMSLIRAVEKFDFARGNKFSTYATWAIIRNFSRTIPQASHHHDRFLTGHEMALDTVAAVGTDEHVYEVQQARAETTVRGLLDRLEDRERRILVSRFGLNGASAQTLEQLGRELGITKERVRQLESRAQNKLRQIAEEEHLDLVLN